MIVNKNPQLLRAYDFSQSFLNYSKSIFLDILFLSFIFQIKLQMSFKCVYFKLQIFRNIKISLNTDIKIPAGKKGNVFKIMTKKLNQKDLREN